MKATLDAFHGSRGVLQVTGLTDNQRGLKIRYKLVQPAVGPETVK